VEIVTLRDSGLIRRCRDLLDRALVPVERDDRFSDGPADDPSHRPADTTGPSRPPPFLAALVGDRLSRHGGSDPLIGYLGGSTERGRLQLDALVDDRRDDGAQVLDRLWSALTDHLRLRSDPAPGPIRPPTIDTIELWGRPARCWHHTVAAAHGFEPVRTIHQMRCRLPVVTEVAPTRPFDPDHDLPELCRVNNRAFASHPDQGNQTIDSLTATMAAPWFRSDGLRILEEDGEMVGFCWTKIHHRPAGRGPDLGEIFVIGIDPSVQGRGLGRPLTAAGLAWLHGQGIDTGMLYVEADNHPAVATYRRLGFTVVRTDRAWARPAGAGTDPGADGGTGSASSPGAPR
jgi:mycothiol synthase